jgi:hypothetical protein
VDARAKALLGGLWCALLGACFLTGRFVPLLSLVDLGFHELGHFVTYVLPWDIVTAAMGSIAQVAVPFGCAAYFYVMRAERVSAAVCLAWAGTSAWGVHVYVADAPYERLELIGGDHDWAFILDDLGSMDAAAGLARLVWLFGLACVSAALALCAWEPFRRRVAAEESAAPAVAGVRVQWAPEEPARP